MRYHRPTAAEITNKVVNLDEWNRRNPIGTAVEVTKDDRSVMETKTASEAWLLGGHTQVVMLAGISGCYALSRVRVTKT